MLLFRVWLPRVVFSVVVTFSSSVEGQAETEFQLWNAVLSTAQLDADAPPVTFWMDVHVRRGNGGTVHIARPGVGYRFADWFTAWAGYAWVPVYPEDEFDPRSEHRLWQQLIFAHSLDSVSLQTRTRFEQRFVEGGDDIGLRVRQFARASWQITSGRAPGFGIVLWDELFVGLNDADWGQVAGFDQNRIFLGPMFQLSNWARLEPGYLMVCLDRAVDRLAHTVSLNLFLSPTL